MHSRSDHAPADVCGYVHDPYQDLDTHRRYCRRRSTDGEPSTSERLTAREALFEEVLETMEGWDGELREEEADGRALPTERAGVERSTTR